MKRNAHKERERERERERLFTLSERGLVVH
jgi:hypothetical protein